MVEKNKDSSGDIVALIDLIRELGFENPKLLSTWIRDVLETDHKLKREFLYKSKFQRDERYLIKSSAKTLVDNLCILKPYRNFFDKSDKSFKSLMNIKNIYDIEPRYSKLEKLLNDNKTMNDRAIENINRFYKVLKERDSIDIKKESIREMFNDVPDKLKRSDFSKTVKISAWQELIEINNKLENENETSDLYRIKGEKLLILENYIDAVDAFDCALKIDGSENLPRILKAKAYWELYLISARKEREVMSESGFEGPEEYPINSEEVHYKQNYEDAWSEKEMNRSHFVCSAFEALTKWSTSLNREHFSHNIYKSESTEVDFPVMDLFEYLVFALNKEDFAKDNTGVRFLKIFKSFKGDKQENPFVFMTFSRKFCFERQRELHFKIKLIEILSWISKKEAEFVIKYMVNEFKIQVYADQYIYVLRDSSISKLFYNFLGVEKYDRVYKRLEKNSANNSKIRYLSRKSSFYFSEVLKHFEKIESMLFYHSRPYIGEKKYEFDEIQKEFDSSMKRAAVEIEGWEKIINESCWKKQSWSWEFIRSSSEIFSFLFFASLIDSFHGKSSNHAKEILSKFFDDENLIVTVVSSCERYISDRRLPFETVKMIFDKLRNKPCNLNKESMNDLADRFFEIKEEEDDKF